MYKHGRNTIKYSEMKHHFDISAVFEISKFEIAEWPVRYI